MRKYIDAELKIVRLSNDIIATSDKLRMGDAAGNGFQMQTSGRRDMFDDSYDEF